MELEHFLGYGETVLDLAAHRALAIIGENGAGKSSLVDAILWALYGESSKGGRRELDDHIQAGHEACRVALEFRLGGQVYRVERTRHRSRNRTTLQLFRRDGNEWQSIGEKAAGDTQVLIERLLRLDYRTFTASAILLQGQADVFTRGMTDTERKAALASILGLDVWERIAERNAQAAAAVEAAVAQAQARLAALRQQLDQARGLQERRQQRVADLEQAQQEIRRIDRDLAELEQALREQTAAVRQLEELSRQADELARERRDLDRRSQELEVQRRQLQALLEQQAAIEQAVARHEALQQAIASMERQADRYVQLMRRQQALERAIAQRQQEHDSHIARLRAELEPTRRQALVMDQVPCARTDLAGRCPLLAHARQAAARLPELERALADASQALPIPEEDELVDVVEELDRLGNVQQALAAARRELAEVAAVARRAPELAAAQARLAALDERLAELAAAAERWQARQQEVEAQRQALARAADEARHTEQRLLTARQARARTEQTVQALREELGRIDAQLAQAEQVRVEAEALERRLAELAEARTVHALIREACSPKGGVPALVVENTVPQIESGANDLLQQLSAGRLRVALETQRQTKAGTFSEALAVRVYVDAIERPYTFLSGAQQWLTDLALRISLSRLLQARAGAEVGLLVIDEGFGSLDAAGRSRVAEAIAALSMQFRKLLVITHLAEMQDILPARITVTRDGSGSRAVIEG